jgi:hypothetical protein
MALATTGAAADIEQRTQRMPRRWWRKKILSSGNEYKTCPYYRIHFKLLFLV